MQRESRWLAAARFLTTQGHGDRAHRRARGTSQADAGAEESEFEDLVLGQLLKIGDFSRNSPASRRRFRRPMRVIPGRHPREADGKRRSASYRPGATRICHFGHRPANNFDHIASSFDAAKPILPKTHTIFVPKTEVADPVPLQKKAAEFAQKCGLNPWEQWFGLRGE